MDRKGNKNWRSRNNRRILVEEEKEEEEEEKKTRLRRKIEGRSKADNTEEKNMTK